MKFDVHTTRRALALLAVATALASGVAACGAEESEPAAAKGDAIVIGAVSSCSGVFASSLGGACPTIKAWADSVNAAGGINGHPVRLIVKDDGGVPEKSLAAVKELVEKEGIVALVGMYSVLDSVWASYISEKGVPVVGGASTQSSFSHNPNFFPSGGQLPSEMYNQAYFAKQANAPKIGVIYCAEDPACAANERLIKRAGEMFELGTSVVYSAGVAGTQPNFTATCVAAKQAGVQTLVVNVASTTWPRIVQACTQQGFRPKFVNGGGSVDPENVKAPSVDEIANVDPNAPIVDDSLPATRAMHEALDKFAPELSQTGSQWNATVGTVWAGGLLFEAAAKAAQLSPDSTPEDVKRGLYALNGDTLGGFAPPLTFTPGKIAHVKCSFFLGGKAGELTAPFGTEPSCAPASDEQWTELLELTKG